MEACWYPKYIKYMYDVLLSQGTYAGDILKAYKYLRVYNANLGLPKNVRRTYGWCDAQEVHDFIQWTKFRGIFVPDENVVAPILEIWGYNFQELADDIADNLVSVRNIVEKHLNSTCLKKNKNVTWEYDICAHISAFFGTGGYEEDKDIINTHLNLLKNRIVKTPENSLRHKLEKTVEEYLTQNMVLSGTLY